MVIDRAKTPAHDKTHSTPPSPPLHNLDRSLEVDCFSNRQRASHRHQKPNHQKPNHQKPNRSILLHHMPATVPNPSRTAPFCRDLPPFWVKLEQFNRQDGAVSSWARRPGSGYLHLSPATFVRTKQATPFRVTPLEPCNAAGTKQTTPLGPGSITACRRRSPGSRCPPAPAGGCGCSTAS